MELPVNTETTGGEAQDLQGGKAAPEETETEERKKDGEGEEQGEEISRGEEMKEAEEEKKKDPRSVEVRSF